MENQVYIVGAHSRSQTLGVYLTKLHKELEIIAYLVDNEEQNEEQINGVPVIYFDETTKLNKKVPVYLGTRGVYHEKLIEKLKKIGMETIIPVTPELDIELRNQYLVQHFAELGRSFDKLNELSQKTCIYVVKSAFDKPLQQAYQLAPFEKEIQVGAVLTENKICDLMDNIGENISDRNRQFCELTALYWIWKNAKEDIVGLEHYRRHFLLSEDWIKNMKENEIDVILPTPLLVMPSLVENYKNRHIAEDWDCMMNYMRKIHPDYYEDAVKFFKTNLYSPCNMFIMKKEVLNELCNWLFPLIFLCAEHIGEREDSYQNRYPGFLAERLITFFFEKNRDKYKIVYADKNFLM